METIGGINMETSERPSQQDSLSKIEEVGENLNQECHLLDERLGILEKRLEPILSLQLGSEGEGAVKHEALTNSILGNKIESWLGSIRQANRLILSLLQRLEI